MLQIADLANSRDRVFPTHARIDRYYPGVAAEEARGVLTRCLDRGEGPALLIGAAGTGKSMLLQVLASEMSKNRTVVYLTSAQLCTRRALLQSILFELGQSYRQRDEGDLRLTLSNYLASESIGSEGLALLVDEAQALPDHLLEELRALGNLSYQGVPTVRLLLAGSQSLEEKFAEPAIEAFNQRIVARCYLAPFSHHDTAQYVRGHVAAAGGNPNELFSADALDAIYNATSGIARLVSQLCDRALLVGVARGQMQINKEIVQNAWADLQQLPTPWNLPDDPAPAQDYSSPQHDESDDQSSVVEFGPLSDDHVGTTTGTFDPPARVYVGQSGVNECVVEEGAIAEGDVEEIVAKEDAQAQSTNAEVVQPPRGQADEGAPGQNAYQGNHQTSAATHANELNSQAQHVVASPAPVDDIFGGDFDEEIVIQDLTPLATAIPPSRPRVTNTCEKEMGQLLSEVPTAEEKPIDAATAEPFDPFAVAPDVAPDTDRQVANDPPRSEPEVVEPSRFTVISGDTAEMQSHSEPDELHHFAGTEDAEYKALVSFADAELDATIDDTELDDEFDELLDDAMALAETANLAITEGGDQATNRSSIDDLGILIVEEEQASPLDTAAAHRADYRQLFNSLRSS